MQTVVFMTTETVINRRGHGLQGCTSLLHRERFIYKAASTMAGCQGKLTSIFLATLCDTNIVQCIGQLSLIHRVK